jgi:hypothetical protein
MSELPEEYRPYPKSIMEGVSGVSTAASPNALPVVIVSMVTVSRVAIFGLTKRGLRRQSFERNAPPVPTRSFRLR